MSKIMDEFYQWMHEINMQEWQESIERQFTDVPAEDWKVELKLVMYGDDDYSYIEFASILALLDFVELCEENIIVWSMLINGKECVFDG